MTREEAKNELSKLIFELGFEDNIDDKVYALNMAIQALSQEPCEDAISRQAVLDGLASIAKAKAKSDAQKSLMGRIMFFMEQLPPVTPQQTECLKAQAKKQVMPMSCDDCCYEPNSPFCEMYRKDICERKDERQSGKWIEHREHCEILGVMPSGLGAYEWCSNCDCGIDVREWHRNNYNYCPNCGARMIEPQESEEV